MIALNIDLEIWPTPPLTQGVKNAKLGDKWAWPRSRDLLFNLHKLGLPRYLCNGKTRNLKFGVQNNYKEFYQKVQN